MDSGNGVRSTYSDGKHHVLVLSCSRIVEAFIGLRISENEIGYCRGVQIGASCEGTVYLDDAYGLTRCIF